MRARHKVGQFGTNLLQDFSSTESLGEDEGEDEKVQDDEGADLAELDESSQGIRVLWIELHSLHKVLLGKVDIGGVLGQVGREAKDEGGVGRMSDCRLGKLGDCFLEEIASCFSTLKESKEEKEKEDEEDDKLKEKERNLELHQKLGMSNEIAHGGVELGRELEELEGLLELMFGLVEEPAVLVDGDGVERGNLEEEEN